MIICEEVTRIWISSRHLVALTQKCLKNLREVDWVMNNKMINSGVSREDEALPTPGPQSLRDHPSSLDQEVLPVDKQPQQPRVQGLQGRHQEETQCSFQSELSNKLWTELRSDYFYIVAENYMFALSIVSDKRYTTLCCFIYCYAF